MFSAAGAYKATKKAATKKAEVKLTTKAAFKRKLITEDKAAQLSEVCGKKEKRCTQQGLGGPGGSKKSQEKLTFPHTRIIVGVSSLVLLHKNTVEEEPASQKQIW